MPKFAVSIPKTLKRHFFRFIYSRFANARGPSLLEWAVIVRALLFVPLEWTWDMKQNLSFLIFKQPQKNIFSNPKTLKLHFFSFILSTVDLPTLEAQACWSEPLLCVRNVLYHYSGLGTWKSFFLLCFFSSQNSPFSNPKTLKRHFYFFQFVYSRFANARGPSLLQWAIFVSAELFVPLHWTWNMITFLAFMIFFSSQISPFSKPTTSKRHYSFFNSSRVDLPTLEAQACWSEPFLWVRNFLYHYTGLWTWKSFFQLWFFSAGKNPIIKP